jgi:Uma2 family endonuclease
MSATAQLDNYIRPLTVHEYQKLSDFGIVNEEEHIELMNGRLIKMAPIGFVHSGIVDFLNYLFHQQLYKKVIVRVQSSILLDTGYMPEPDIVLVNYRDDFYKSRYVKPSDVLLIAEVSDSSFKYDSEIKIPIYAKFKIPEVWIVDVNTQSLIRYTKPTNGVYEHIEIIENLAQVSLTVLPEITLNLSDLF